MGSASSDSAQTGEPVLRIDAERNRARIIETAQRLFSAHGLDVSLASVAREAKVGKATISRHFATRADLVGAVFLDSMDRYLEITKHALAEPDPWNGFCEFIDALCEMQATDRGFAAVLSSTFPAAEALERKRGEAFAGVLQLIAAAKGTGHLREDFVSEDLVLLLMGNAGVVTATIDHAPASWQRFAGQMTRAYAAPGAPLPPLAPAPSSDNLYLAMGRGTARPPT